MSGRFRWAALVRNPVAGRVGDGGEPGRFRGILEKAGIPLVESVTRGPGDATRIAAEFARAGAPLLVAWGGDGTVAETARALAGTGTALGIIPRGTVNVLARETRIPFALERAARVLLTGRVVGARPGMLRTSSGEHLFVALASVGLDAQTAHRMADPGSRRRGLLPWFAAGLRVFFTAPLPELSVTADGIRQTATWVGFGKQPRYIHSLRAFPGASLEEDRVILTVLKSRTRLGYLFAAAAARCAVPGLLPSVTVKPVREAAITSVRAPVACEADGSPAGMTPARVRVLEKTLRLVLP